jgi:hypothetical protein
MGCDGWYGWWCLLDGGDSGVGVWVGLRWGLH